jgi:hypothetical protein
MVQRMGEGMTTEVKPVVEGLRSVIADDVIAAAAEKFGPLTADTKEGYRDIKEAIAWCRNQRGAVEAKRKNLNEEALKWQRTVNAEAKRITSSLEAIEEPLKAKKQAVDDKVERDRAELAAKHQAWIDGRIAESVKVTGKPISTAEAETWTDEQFAEHLEAGRKARAEADAKAKAEAARLAQEEADRKAEIKAEQDQIAADRAALARQKDEQDQRDRDIEAKLAKIQEAEERAARIQPATLIGENDLAGKVACVTVGIPGDVFASRIQSVDAPMSNEDMAQVEAMANFRVDGVLPASLKAEPDTGLAVVSSCEAEAAEDLQGESRDALVGSFDSVDPVCAVPRMAVTMDTLEHDHRRTLIAPMHDEIMDLLRSMQVGAIKLEAKFDDFVGSLEGYQSMAKDIRLAVESLQEQMDKYTA